MPSESAKLIDLFCGCGGFSLGAELAGFHSLVAIDNNPILQSGYKKNFPNTRAIEADVGEILRSDWRQLIGNIRPDGIIGGPPCQGFSRIGKRSKSDPRNTLIHHFYRHVDELRPKFFVMENVEGLLDEGNRDVLMSAIERVADRYTILGPLVVNAAHFGAATNRRRVIVVGYDPEECDTLSVEQLQPIPGRLTTVRDAISDLPTPIKDSDQSDDFGWTKYSSRLGGLSTYARILRDVAPKGLGWAEAVRLHKEGFVSGLHETRHTAKVAHRYALIENGKSDPISKSYRLKWDGQCPTIRAGTGSERGSFQAVRPLHPAEARVITVREAARMQAFPDWFVFHPTKWHSFRMIGNSVSPSVSFGLLSKLLGIISVPDEKYTYAYNCMSESDHTNGGSRLWRERSRVPERIRV